ncbi:MAG: site-specific DNA-methyltransferase [Treponema sp.]|jgi:site-specific DNA-methyltransferase (adenine-specific)|nr:site-specific DNA-methyltransferase [Treponema sp.]
MENSIINGDCINVMKKFDESSIACCITDPPYNYEFIGRKWDNEEIQRRINRIHESKTLVKNIPYGSGLAGGVRNKRWYERNYNNNQEYMLWCEKWGNELFRICKSGAPIAIFNSTRTVAHVQVALEKAGFYTRDILVYRRHSGIPKGLNIKRKLEKIGYPNANQWEGWHSCFRNEWEAILLTQKPLRNNYWGTLQETGVGLFKTINDDGSFQSNIFEGYSNKSEETFEHCTVKPISLIKKLIKILVPKNKSNIIIDPFAGSGTTLVAAKELGYKYIGIEIESSYIKIIESRLKQNTYLTNSTKNLQNSLITKVAT